MKYLLLPVVFAVSAVSGQVLVEIDFDTSEPVWIQAAVYNFEGGTPSWGVTYPYEAVGSSGKGGEAYFDVAGTVAPGWGPGTGVFRGEFFGNGVAGPSDVREDYMVSLDVRIEGQLDSPVTAEIYVNGNSGFVFTAPVDSAWQTITFSLAEATETYGLFDRNSFATTTVFGVNFNAADVSFGYDDGNRIFVDNLSITAVPEPATFGLLAGVGALAALIYRRRS